MKTSRLFGFEFVSSTVDKVCMEIMNSGLREKVWVITPNVEQVVKYRKIRKFDPTFVEDILERAIVLPDGQPIVWSSRLYKDRLTMRLAGSDIFPKMIRLIDEREKKAYLVGASSRVLLRIIDKLKNKNNFQVYGPQYFEAENRREIVEKMIYDIENFFPDFVFVGLSFPKGEKAILDVIKTLERKEKKIPLFFCVGASLEFFAGTKKRAPLWMQKIGLEWAFRFAQEPRRLWKRFLIEYA